MAKRIVRGQDLMGKGSFSEDEIKASAAFYSMRLGTRLVGLEFWNEHGPDTIRLYRRYSDIATPNQYESNRQIASFGPLPFYAILGYQKGVRYLLQTRQGLGMSRTQLEEGIAVAFLVCGPAGMETIALALEGFDWSVVPAEPAVFPEGWRPDPAAFRSGLDFSTDEMTRAELKTLEEWYAAVLGEVPGRVRFLGRERPNMLKAMRNRWESCLVEVPKQLMPTSLLHYHVTMGSKEGIRENVLLARAWGVEKRIVLNIIGSALLNGGDSVATLVETAAGDVFESWER